MIILSCTCPVDVWDLCVWPSEPATLIEDDEDKEEPAPALAPKPAAAPATQSAIDVTADFLLPLLNPENVANLVSLQEFRISCEWSTLM